MSLELAVPVYANSADLERPEFYIGAITAGASFLDQVYPGWERRIDPGALSVASLVGCVACQASGMGFAAFCATHQLDYCATVALGFMTPAPVERGANVGAYIDAIRTAFSALGTAWMDLIKNRFETGTLSDH